jgi:short-subunit dehydrogenase
MLCNQSGFKVIGSSTTGNNILDNANFKCLKLDLSSSVSISQFVKSLSDIKLDFLLNNAGVLLDKWDASTVNTEQLKKTFEINVFGTIELTENCYHYLIPMHKLLM